MCDFYVMRIHDSIIIDVGRTIFYFQFIHIKIIDQTRRYGVDSGNSNHASITYGTVNMPYLRKSIKKIKNQIGRLISSHGSELEIVICQSCDDAAVVSDHLKSVHTLISEQNQGALHTFLN